MSRPSANAAELKLYNEIRRAIAERRLKPGVKLTEDTLASLFKVSRARVRKILMLLAKENIVKHEPNRGAFVLKPSVSEARNILDARRLVECHLVRQASSMATKRQVKNLRSILVQEKNAKIANDYSLMMRLSGEFHIALAECAGNQILSAFLADLISRSYLILAVYQRRDSECCPQNDHTEIVNNLENSDADAAVIKLNQHFNHIEEELDLREEIKFEKVEISDILHPPM